MIEQTTESYSTTYYCLVGINHGNVQSITQTQNITILAEWLLRLLDFGYVKIFDIVDSA